MSQSHHCQWHSVYILNSTVQQKIEFSAGKTKGSALKWKSAVDVGIRVEVDKRKYLFRWIKKTEFSRMLGKLNYWNEKSEPMIRNAAGQRKIFSSFVMNKLIEKFLQQKGNLGFYEIVFLWNCFPLKLKEFWKLKKMRRGILKNFMRRLRRMKTQRKNCGK